jgi:hypothetical protein
MTRACWAATAASAASRTRDSAVLVRAEAPVGAQVFHSAERAAWPTVAQPAKLLAEPVVVPEVRPEHQLAEPVAPVVDRERAEPAAVVFTASERARTRNRPKAFPAEPTKPRVVTPPGARSSCAVVATGRRTPY